MRVGYPDDKEIEVTLYFGGFARNNLTYHLAFLLSASNTSFLCTNVSLDPLSKVPLSAFILIS